MFSLLKIFFKYPRSRVFLFLSCSNRFRDNCKYAYIALEKKYPKAKFIWITREEKDISHFQELGINAYSRENNPIFIHYLTRFAKYHFCDGGWILNYPSTYNKSFNFWHGTLGKYNMYDALGEPKRNLSEIMSLRRNAKNMILVNISHSVNQYLLKTYRLCEFDIPLILGQPRIRPLITPIEKVDEFITENDTFLKQLKKERQHFKTVYCYAPTYRDNGSNFLKELHLDIDKLNEVLAKKNALMIFKMHPLCNLQNTKHLSNIRCADKYTDIYPLVAMCDVVVGDYSSLYFDVLVCKDKKQILLHGDIKKYRQKCRNINEEHLADMTKGLVLDDFRDLIRFIEGKIKYITPPKEIMEKHWDKKVIENPDCYMSHIK